MQQIAASRSLSDLRRAWNETDALVSWQREPTGSVADYAALGKTARAKFSELGLDFSSGDERIRYFNEAFAHFEAGEAETAGGADSGDMTPIVKRSKALGAIHMLLSGTRQGESGRLELIPPEDVVELHSRSLTDRFISVAGDYTKGDEFTTSSTWDEPNPRHRYREARRFVTDPSSEFWGCGVRTSKYEMRHSKEVGETMELFIPTGRLKVESLESESPLVGMVDFIQYRAEFGGEIPRTIIAHKMEGNTVHEQHPNLDTSTQFVKRFVEYMEGVTNKPGAIPSLR
jgi:hypothetical protein